MELDRAREIIRSLADGRDPATGEPFPPGSPYQQAETVRALFMALETMGKARPTREPRPMDPDKAKAGAAWSPEEEARLRDGFTAHKPIPELAAAHGRTRGAITARLVRLGLLEDTATNRAGQGNRPIRPMGALPGLSLPGTHFVATRNRLRLPASLRRNRLIIRD